MKINTYKSVEGKIEATAVITFFIVFFVLTIVAGQLSAQVVNGNSGRCREFDGNTSHITFSNNNLGLGSGNTMTVTAWVKCNSTTNEGSWANIATLNDGNSNGDVGQFWLQHSSDNSVFEFAVMNTSSSRSYVQSVTAPTTGVWYHVAGVYDGSFINLYVNGVLESRTAFTGTINNFQGNFNFNIGQWSYNGNAYRRFNGDIDEVTIWNTALTQTQIRTYMCQKLQGNEAGLVGYWNMNEQSGNTITDKTSNGRNGTAVSTSIVWSGAPIGNTSTFTYGGSKLALSNPTYSDSLVVNTFSSTPTGIFIYRIDTTPNYTTAPSGYSVLTTNYYYGVFIVGSTTPTYTASYYYTGNPVVTIPSLFGMVSRNNNSISTWTNISAILNASLKVFQKTGQSGRNEYDMALTTGGLPIKLAEFTATPNGNQIDIKWTTSTEVNNSYFTIERTTNGLTYETVAVVQGAGNSDVVKNYSAVDKSPIEGVSYYRLRQTDYDGNSQTFPLVSVSFSQNAASGISIQNMYPNPFKTNFTINFECDNAGSVTMEIMNMNGMVVDKAFINTQKGYNSYNYTNGYMLTTGTYIIYITNESTGEKTVQKIIKG